MTQRSSKRQEMRSRQQRQQMRSKLIWGGLGLIVLIVIGVIVWQGLRPRMGEEVPIMTSSHIAADSDPGEYNTDPPTSGPLYPDEAEPGFYDTNTYQYPAGHLVHNLEHGYIIFWYNCGQLGKGACTNLKSQVKSVMDEFNNVKVIAYPWDSIDVPIVMTSWARLLKMETFDAEQARTFYKTNLNKSPEPNAP